MDSPDSPTSPIMLSSTTSWMASTMMPFTSSASSPEYTCMRSAAGTCSTITAGKTEGSSSCWRTNREMNAPLIYNQPSCDAFNGKAVKCTIIALKHTFAPTLQMKASNPQSSRLLILTEAAANGPFIIALTWAGSVTWLDSYYASE